MVLCQAIFSTEGWNRVAEVYQNHTEMSGKAVIDYDIPHRIKDGYGLNIRMVNEAYEAGVDTIITCDNGIAAFDAVARAKELGMTVIVTDHHDIPYHVNEDGSQTISFACCRCGY